MHTSTMPRQVKLKGERVYLRSQLWNVMCLYELLQLRISHETTVNYV